MKTTPYTIRAHSNKGVRRKLKSQLKRQLREMQAAVVQPEPLVETPISAGRRFGFRTYTGAVQASIV